jgi:hypothetical protein
VIVFDLKCAHAGHIFEAWFGCSDAYVLQREKRQIVCPMCGDSEIEKALMAPNIGAKGNTGTSKPIAANANMGTASIPEAKALLATLAKIQASLIAKSTWVGRDFARQVRAMDAGDAKTGSIFGEASPSEAKSLIEDGIEIINLPLPVIPPDQCN